jgi:hypothetical protein
LGKQKIKKMDLSQVNFTPLEGEIMQNTADGKYYIWYEDNWHEFSMENSGIEMGLYDMNKQIIAQLPDLTDWDRVEQLFNDFHTSWKNKYYMMYGKEISYFTVFKVVEPHLFGSVVMDCIPNVGIVKAIDLTETEDAVEIWVMYEDEPTCLYLFPYDMGIVQVGE